MALFEEEPRPKPVTAHEIGSDLSRLSLEELHERVALLEAEINRLRLAGSAKSASRSAADAVFGGASEPR